MVANWLENLACNAEYGFEPPLNRLVFGDIDQLLGVIDVLLHGRVAVLNFGRKAVVLYSCIV